MNLLNFYTVQDLCGFPGALKYFEVLDRSYKYSEALSGFHKCLQARYKWTEINIIKILSDI